MKLDNLHFALIAIVVLLVVLCGRDLVEGNSSGYTGACKWGSFKCPEDSKGPTTCEKTQWPSDCEATQKQSICRWDNNKCSARDQSSTHDKSMCDGQTSGNICEWWTKPVTIRRSGSKCKWCSGKCLSTQELITEDTCPHPLE